MSEATKVEEAKAANKGNFPVPIPFLEELGAEFVRMENGQAEIALTLGERHTNSWLVAHGGVVMTLLDVVMSMSGRSMVDDSLGAITIEMKVSFMLPAGSPGKRIVARGRVLHRSKSMCFCEADVWDGEHMAARAMGTFKLVKRLEAAKKLEQH